MVGLLGSGGAAAAPAWVQAPPRELSVAADTVTPAKSSPTTSYQASTSAGINAANPAPAQTTIGAAAGGTLTLRGAISNALGTIQANAGTVTLDSATISGGVLATSQSGAIHVTSDATLDGSANNITLTAGGLAVVDPDGTLTLKGTLAVSGVVDSHAAGTVAAVTNGGSVSGVILLDGGRLRGGTITTDANDARSALEMTVHGGTLDGTADTVTLAGVAISGGSGTVTNAGMIGGGGTDAVTLAAGFANRVILDPGASFVGVVDGGNPAGGGIASTLELAGGAGATTLSGLGSQFINFSTVAIDPGAFVRLSGGNSLVAGVTLADAGELNIAGGASLTEVVPGVVSDAPGAASGLTVDGAGFGALQLSGGAAVTAGSLDAGVISSAVGQISLSGSGTELLVTNAATVADDGTGVLSVLSGATVAAASLTIGSQGDSSGALVVSGAGSLVRLSGELNIGTSLGVGDLTVGPGAVVHASVVNLQGQVVLEGGLLDPTVQLINQGQTAGGYGTLAAGDIVDEGVIQAGGTKPSQKLLLVEGAVLGGGTLTVNGTLGLDTALLWETRGAAPLVMAGTELAAARRAVTVNTSHGTSGSVRTTSQAL
jgi:T5SS/PEP-CTERM-associated repeat protein